MINHNSSILSCTLFFLELGSNLHWGMYLTHTVVFWKGVRTLTRMTIVTSPVSRLIRPTGSSNCSFAHCFQYYAVYLAMWRLTVHLSTGLRSLLRMYSLWPVESSTSRISLHFNKYLEWPLAWSLSTACSFWCMYRVSLNGLTLPHIKPLANFVCPRYLDLRFSLFQYAV
jgi:hypothetical protein